MARHRNENWNLQEGRKEADGTRVVPWETVHSALLMDIRDELKRLNETLGCHRVGRMCDDINRIDRRIQKHMPLAKGRKKGS